MIMVSNWLDTESARGTPLRKAREPSAYLLTPRRTLQAVCRAMRRDDQGRACAACDLRDLCVRQVAALVTDQPLSSNPGYNVIPPSTNSVAPVT